VNFYAELPGEVRRWACRYIIRLISAIIEMLLSSPEAQKSLEV